MTYDYRELEMRLRDLLISLSGIRSLELNEVYHFLEVGEYGLAFETICDLIREKRIEISSHAQQEIVALAGVMEIDSRWWKDIVD